MIKTHDVPQHIAIMMDGNGRWAKGKHMPRSYGHKEGAKTFDNVCRVCNELGIKYLTVFSFSTENWSRPFEEVTNIFDILKEYLLKNLNDAINNNMKVRFIGNSSKLDSETQKLIRNFEAETEKCSGLQVQIALNFGGKDEIVRAVKKMMVDFSNGKLLIPEIDEHLLSSYLDTADVPEPDLFIRTGGEERISNFLLWEFSYTEFYFTKILWPDFTREELINAINRYMTKERRYGRIVE